MVHSIRTAQMLKEIEDVYVSTDCSEIANISKQAGAKIIKRPLHLATDTASEWLSWQHAIDWVEKERGAFKRFLSLPTTAPCRSIEDVEKCLDALTDNVDIVLTKTESMRSPWFNMVIQNPNREVQLVIRGDDYKRRQDVPRCFDITTVAYVTRPSFVMESNGIWDGKVTSVDVPPERAIDIDSRLDYEIARFLKEENISKEFNGII